MIRPQLLLAAANWTSLIILIWLLVLNIAPLGGVQAAALIFFFITALVATAYDPQSSKVVSRSRGTDG